MLRKQARKTDSEHVVRCSLLPGKKEGKQKKTLTELQLRAFFPKTGQNGKKSSTSTVTMSAPTWKKPKKNRKTESSIFRKKGTCNSRRKDATQRSQWTEFCTPEPNRVRTRTTDQDAIVSETTQTMPMENVHTIARCFQKFFVGIMEFPIVKSCETRVLEKAGCSPY